MFEITTHRFCQPVPFVFRRETLKIDDMEDYVPDFQVVERFPDECPVAVILVRQAGALRTTQVFEAGLRVQPGDVLLFPACDVASYDRPMMDSLAVFCHGRSNNVAALDSP